MDRNILWNGNCSDNNSLFEKFCFIRQSDKISRGKDITSEVSINNKGIAIHSYAHSVKLAFSSIETKPLIELQSPVILPSNDVDNLWQSSWYFRDSSNYRSSWPGCMGIFLKENTEDS